MVRRTMKPFAVLIFEINCYEYEPLIKIHWGKGYEWGRKPIKDSASIWLHIATDAAAQTRIPADLAHNCIKLCGPMSWEIADETLRGVQARFDHLGIEHFELTYSDD